MARILTLVVAMLFSPGAITESTADRLERMQVTEVVPPPLPEHFDIWVRLAECESGSRWDYNGPSGYDGGLQFSPRSWRAVNGTEFSEYAWQSEAIVQMYVAERLLAIQGWGRLADVRSKARVAMIEMEPRKPPRVKWELLMVVLITVLTLAACLLIIWTS